MPFAVVVYEMFRDVGKKSLLLFVNVLPSYVVEDGLFGLLCFDGLPCSDISLYFILCEEKYNVFFKVYIFYNFT